MQTQEHSKRPSAQVPEQTTHNNSSAVLDQDNKNLLMARNT
jgi:hypothetical protein